MSTEPPDTPVRCPARPSYLWLKAVIDRYVALVVFVMAAPLLATLAWLVRRDSPGPAFFRQTRAGLHGRPFTLLKFRTMRTDADPFGDSPQTGGDPRITRMGRWLRETSLDELPQLLNMLRGEMSLVGPRPLYLQQMVEWGARQRGRLLVKPGLTGLAQINGRGSITIEEKLEWDVRYVESVCLRTDLGILWHTFRSVWARSGIYEVQYSRAQERRSTVAPERGR
ncbi:MAG: sugar transferase [Planctomycetes bacterium]|nr:sugar transferase [Planctomycetota bacterium]